MRKSFLAASTMGICAIGLGAVATFGAAFAQSSLTVHPRRGVPLPAYVTSSDDWLNPGNVQTPGEAARSNNYARLVQDPIGNIVQVGPSLGPMPWD